MQQAHQFLLRSLFTRFLTILPSQNKRPYLATECHSLQEAEKWRHQIIKEIARKVSQIQNAGLGEFRIRDLNDEINKLIREKGHWLV